jgi:hypothetical protein
MGVAVKRNHTKAQLAAAAVCSLGLAPPSGLAARATEAGELARESAVLEAAFRQQIEEHLDASARAARTVVCLAIDPGGAPQSPSRELMARLAKEPAVRRAAECDPRPKGAVEATTLRPAVIVTAGPIDWVAADEAWVAVSYFRSARRSAHRRYRVVRERDGWVSLGPILIDGPL